MTASTSQSRSTASDTNRQAKSVLCTPAPLLAQFSCPLPSRSYARQYAALYDFRLRKLRKSRLLTKARRKWEEEEVKEEQSVAGARIRHTPRILDVQRGQVTYVTGIIYMEMKLKPDVLQDLTREQYLPPLPPVSSYVDPSSDSVYLEDESGRLKLVGPIFTSAEHRGALVTGAVGAFLGTERENGEFHVQDVCWPGLPESQTSMPKQIIGGESNKKVKLEDGTEDLEREDDEYVVLLSGLDLGDSETDASFDGSDHADLGFAQTEMRMSMLQEWISGEMASHEHRSVPARIAGIVIAGNLLAVQRADGSLFSALEGTAEGNLQGKATSHKGSKSAASKAKANLESSPPATLLAHVVQLSASLPVVLMPGSTDPASAALPQQAIHRAVLRGAEKWAGELEGGDEGQPRVKKESKSSAQPSAAGGVHLYNNPSWVQFGSQQIHDTRILACSGQNIDDTCKYVPPVAALAEMKAESQDEDLPDPSEGSSQDERLLAACRLLDYGHVAPTAPDTLWCFPFTDRDPFIIDDVPDVLLIGNQPHFASTVYQPRDDDPEGCGATRVVLVPRFSKTGEVALLNLRTKGVKKVTIGWNM